MTKKLIFILTTLFLLTFLNPSQAQQSYMVNSTKINVRKEPNIKSEILGTIAKGEIVTVNNTDIADWWFISYYGYEGYVSSALLVALEETKEYGSYRKLETKTGENYDCENIQPLYDDSINNELAITVGYISDAVVKLMTYEGICIRIAYIKGGDKFSMKNIPLGDYYLRIAYGKDFRKSTENNNCIVKFLRDPIYKKGEQNLKFIKRRNGVKVVDGKEYAKYDISYFELTLNTELPKGTKTFNSTKISQKDFNQ